MNKKKRLCGGGSRRINFVKKHLIDILVVTAFILVLAFFYVTEIHCPFRRFFHRPCPACGMSRAIRALLRGDIIAAFRYHPLFFTLPVPVALFVLKDKLTAYEIAICSFALVHAFIVVYAIRYFILGG